MSGSFDSALSRFKDSLKEEILPMGFPSWHRRYRSIFQDYQVEEERIERSDWSIYISEKLKKPQQRLYFALKWPLMPAQMRKDVLVSLQNAMVRGVKVNSHFEAQSTLPGSCLPIAMQLDNAAGHCVRPNLPDKNCRLSFAVLDNDLLFEVPAQPYHTYRSFFFVPDMKEQTINHIFADFL